MTDEQELVDAALAVRDRAYARYSHFAVGAAIRGSDGKIYVGCNVENASYGLSLCAERTAAVRAVAEGCRTFQAIAVATSGGGSPCGACRQFLVEFAPWLNVLRVDADSGEVVHRQRLDELLFDAFRWEEE